MCAALNASWFDEPAARAENEGGSDSDNDEGQNAEDQKAVAAAHASQCIDACTAWISHDDTNEAMPPTNWNKALHNCIGLWRAKFKYWQEPCGNHLNVPDLLFVASCHLRVALMPKKDRHIDHSLTTVTDLKTYLEAALKTWNRAPSVLHTETRSVIDHCARVIVFWGSNVVPGRLTDTTLSAEDVSMLTMNVNVHQSLDNRARNTDLAPVPSSKSQASASHATQAVIDDEELLHSVVCLASRYAFFVSLHNAARLAAPSPQLEVHRRISSEAMRPESDLVKAGVMQLQRTFQQCARASMPEIVQREINYTIWKCLLSVGSMEVSIVRFLCKYVCQAYLRMTPTIEWHKLNPVTVSIREPTAATVPGSLARAAAIADYTEADAEWPEYVRLCHREVWHLTLWHQLLTEIDIDFLRDYVVLAHDIREKSDVIGRSKFNMLPRRPVVVYACATWCVHAYSVVWHTESVDECIYLWAWLIVRFYDGRDETGTSLHNVLHRSGLKMY